MSEGLWNLFFILAVIVILGILVVGATLGRRAEKSRQVPPYDE